MPSPNYTAYTPSVTFVDDIAGAGGTALVAANFNGLRNDLGTYVQNHINGVFNNHDAIDVVAATLLNETTAYTNVAGGGAGAGTLYHEWQRNDMWANLFRVILGGTGTLTARLATFTGNTGSDINTMYTLLHTATSAIVNASLMQRDANGGVQATYIGLVPTGSFAGFNVQAGNTYTGIPYTYTKSGSADSFSVGNDASVTAKNGTFTGALSAASLSLTASLFASLISDYRPTTHVTAGHITVKAGGAMSDSGGNQVGPVGSDLDVNIVGTIAQPSGSNSQYLALSIPVGWNGTAANLVSAMVAGTAAASPTKPAMPAGNEGIGWLLWRGPSASAGAGANASGVFLASDIVDARFGGGAGSGGGTGTVDSNLRTAPFMLFGSSAYAGAGLDMSNSATAARVHTNLLRDLSTDASLYDTLLNYVQPDLLSRTIVTGGGAGVQVLASADGTAPGPVTMAVGGKKRKITTTVSTVPQAGASGPRYLIIDANSPGTGPTWTLVNPMPGPTQPALAANQMLIAQYWFDNASGLLKPNTSVDFSNVASLTSGNVKLETVTSNGVAGATTITGNSAFQVITNVPTTPFYLPKAATCFLLCQAGWAANATQTNSQIGTFVDNNYHEPSSIFVPGYGTPTGNEKRSNGGLILLGAGAHTMTQQAYVTTGNSLIISTAYCEMTLLCFM